MADRLDQLQARTNSRQYRDELQADLAEAGYTDEYHRNAKPSFRSQLRLNTRRNFELRDFTKATQWENPEGVPQSIDPETDYLPNMARAQARVIVAMQDQIAKSSLGRGLLDQAHRGQVQFGFGILNAGQTIAGFLEPERQVIYNVTEELAASEDGPWYLANAAIHTAHELGHAAQLKAAFDGAPRQCAYVYSLSDLLLKMRHDEAGATAASIQVAWEMAEAGNVDGWSAVAQAGPDMDASEAFAQTVVNDRQTLTDGRARRAAHDAWFESTDRVAAYEDGVVEDYHEILEALAMQQAADYPHPNARALAAVIGGETMPLTELENSGAMPGVVNHATVATGHDLRDPRYQKISNPRVAEQAEFLDQIAAKFRAGEQVTPVMLSGYHAIAAKYDGTVSAQVPPDPDVDNSIPGMPEHPLDRMYPVRNLDEWRKKNAGEPAPEKAAPSAPSLRRDLVR